MNDQEIKAIYHKLTDNLKKRVHKEAKIIQECAAEYFYVETGCQADDPSCYWLLRAFAMVELRLMTVDWFYGIEK